jgi:phosphate:Na+ symporter
MTVSFVNAGLLSLVESAGVMMGANIGTTTTAWIVSYFGFKFKIATVALPIIAIGMPLMFFKRSSAKAWAEFLIGFALLFLGLNELKEAVPDIKNNPEILAFLADYAHVGFLSTLMFVGVGAILTILIQSSSAAMTLTLVMCYNGWIPFEVAAAMVLGENIGTTVTAELASLVGNVHAKRSARIHSMFNIIGVTWMVILLPFFLPLIEWFTVDVMGNKSPYESNEAVPFALSYFHTAFNLINVLLLIGFVPTLVRVAKRSVPQRKDESSIYHLEYIGGGVTGTPELSLLEAKKEVAKFGKIVRRQTGFVNELLTEQESDKQEELIGRIRKYEEITDRIENEVAEFLTKVSEGELSARTSRQIRGILGVINDLERIGDICFQMSVIIERKNKDKIWFTPKQRQGIQEMFVRVDKALELMERNLQFDEEDIDLTQAIILEEEVNSLRDQLKQEHLKSTEKKQYNYQSGIIYADLFSCLEKIGDHVINVSEYLDTEED